MLGSLFSGDSNIDGYLLVYDITSRTSLENLEYFDELIEKNMESGLRPQNAPMPVKIVAGNKCDLSESRSVSSAEGLAWAKAHGCGFMETSAKVMVNIEETFETLIRQVARNRAEAQNPTASASRAKAKPQGPATPAPLLSDLSNTMRNKEEVAEPKKRNTCCIIC